MDFLWLPSFWVAAVPLIIFLAIKLHFSKRYYKLAAKLPGPPTWPFVGNSYRDFQPVSAKILYDLCRLIHDYGGFVRLWFGPNLTVLISKLEDLEVYFSHPKLLDKSSNYHYFRPGLGKGLFTANGDIYKRVKKHYISTFSTTVLRECVPIFVRRGNILLERLAEMDGKPEFNANPQIFHYTYTSICDIALEYDVDGKAERHQNIGVEIEYLAHKSYERILNPLEYSDTIFPYTPNGRNYMKVLHHARESARQVIDAKRNDMEEMKMNNPEEFEKKQGVFIYRILEDPQATEEELIDHVATMIATGSDTTASTINFTLMMLGAHPEIQEKVYEEAMLVHEKLGGRPMDADDVEEYKYIDMVIKETLRLFPIGPVLGRVAGEDVYFGKHLVPKGADIFFVPMYTNRDPMLYPDPLKFDPERFQPELCEKRHRFEYIPFAAGPRACIGAKYATMSMKMTIASIIRNFRVYSNRKVTDIKLSGEVTLKSGDGCIIRVEKRHDKLIKNNCVLAA